MIAIVTLMTVFFFAFLSGYLTTRLGGATQGASLAPETVTPTTVTALAEESSNTGAIALESTPRIAGMTASPITSDAVTPIAGADPAVGVASAAGLMRQPATVVGTEQLDIRSCPETSCEVVTTAPLGASLTLLVTDDASEEIHAESPDFAASGRFVLVESEGNSGYAQDLFVTTEPAHVPYLLQGTEGCKRVALIFNIGVGAEPAIGILDTLETERVPATMFVMGWWADAHPSILQRMVDEGYIIGSHGYDNIELTSRPDDEVAEDIERATAAIEHATGKPIDRYFTPYAAAINERVRAVAAARGFLPVAWTVSAADYGADATADSVYDRVIDEIHDGGIVELHLDAPASAESTGRALPRIIAELRTKGYRFVTIPEMTLPCP